MAASGGLEALHRQIRGVRAGSAGPATLPSAHRQAILPSNGPGVLTSCWHDAGTMLFNLRHGHCHTGADTTPLRSKW